MQVLPLMFISKSKIVIIESDCAQLLQSFVRTKLPCNPRNEYMNWRYTCYTHAFIELSIVLGYQLAIVKCKITSIGVTQYVNYQTWHIYCIYIFKLGRCGMVANARTLFIEQSIYLQTIWTKYI